MILWVTYGMPYPPNCGAGQRDYALITRVSRSFDIKLLCLVQQDATPASVNHMRRWCRTVEWVVLPPRTPMAKLRTALNQRRRGRPLAFCEYYSAELAAHLRRTVAGGGIDLVQVEHSLFAPYLDFVEPLASTKTVLSFHNLARRQYRSMLGMGGGWLQRASDVLKILLTLHWEARYAARFDHCLAVSPVELDWLHREDPRIRLGLVPNGVDVEEHRPLPAPDHGTELLFVGNLAYRPNVDAVVHFCHDILPEVQRQMPQVELMIVGRTPPPMVVDLQRRPGVTVYGTIPDVLPFYRRCLATVVPLRAGGGTRLKILESMALGRPVITTPMGCEGLQVESGRHLLVAGNAGEFAAQTVRAMSDRSLREHLTGQARRLVEEVYDWNAIARELVGQYRQLLGLAP